MKSLRIQFVTIFLAATLAVPAFVHAEQNSIPNPFSPAQKGKCRFGNDQDGVENFEYWVTSLASLFESPDMGPGSVMIHVLDWDSPNCTFDDGRPRLSVLLKALSKSFDDEKNWDKSLQRVEGLKLKYPNSALGVVVEASYWATYAWHARGHGYSSTVTPEGWHLFHERMEKSEKILADNKTVGDTLPNWYELMLEVKGALGRSEEERGKIFYEGAKKYKNYLPLYFKMSHYLQPLWGGKWETVDEMVTWSVNNTKDSEGQSLYARIYWSVGKSVVYKNNLFAVSPAKWPKMRAGFEDLMIRYPKSKWNLNYFAMFACHAGDKKTFLNLRKKMADNIMDDAWSSTVSLELCENKFNYKK